MTSAATGRRRANYVIKRPAVGLSASHRSRQPSVLPPPPPPPLALPRPSAIALYIPTRPILRRFRESCHRSAAILFPSDNCISVDRYRRRGPRVRGYIYNPTQAHKEEGRGGGKIEIVTSNGRGE